MTIKKVLGTLNTNRIFFVSVVFAHYPFGPFFKLFHFTFQHIQGFLALCRLPSRRCSQPPTIGFNLASDLSFTDLCIVFIFLLKNTRAWVSSPINRANKDGSWERSPLFILLVTCLKDRSGANNSVWPNPKSERNRIRNFFPIPIFFDTESDVKIFRNWYDRYHQK